MNKALFFLFILITILFSSSIYATVEINEVMYNPECYKDYCEWVELYNPHNHTINLTNCEFDGKELSGNINANEYLILVKNKENFTHYFNSDNHINNNQIIELSFSLSNSGEELVLESDNGTNNNCSDKFDYSDYTNLGDENNKTLEKRNDDTWGESIANLGTPGEINSIDSFSEDYSDLFITEFIPDPFDEDSKDKPYGEWVELYNNGKNTINLKGLIIKDNNDEHEIYIAENKIIGEIFLEPNSYIVIYKDGDSDFALNNNGLDEVRLFDSENNPIDSVSYSDSTEGMSWSKINDDWYRTKPTPNEENEFTENCDWTLDVNMDKSIFQKEQFNFLVHLYRNYGEKQNITVDGIIEDYFGEYVKEYSPWTDKEVTTEVSKTYTPNLAEGIYQLTFTLNNLTCHDDNENDNKITKFFAINPEYNKKESTLEIEKIYLGSDDKAKWGDQFTVKVNVYKGDSTKTAIELWAEQDGESVSKRSKINIYDNYQDYTLTLPIQLEPNCANELSDDGNVNLILRGLDKEVTTTFPVEELNYDICKDYIKYINKLEREALAAKKANAYQIIDLPTEVKPGQVLKTTLQLWEEDAHEFNVWSYVYRGSKCYSCEDNNKERDDNSYEFKLKENELKIIDLFVKLDSEMEEGEYKVMFKINKDNQKTSKSVSEKVYVINEKGNNETNYTEIELKDIEESVETFSESKEDSTTNNQLSLERLKIINSSKGIIVYESNSEKAKRLIPYFLALTFVLLFVTIIRKK